MNCLEIIFIIIILHIIRQIDEEIRRLKMYFMIIATVFLLIREYFSHRLEKCSHEWYSLQMRTYANEHVQKLAVNIKKFMLYAPKSAPAFGNKKY